MEIVNLIIGVVGVALALIALAIALPAFLQMLCGRPSIEVRFDASMEVGAKLLICAIQNEPVTNQFLRKIGITRMPVMAFASFDIRVHGTNRILPAPFAPSSPMSSIPTKKD